MPEKETIKDRRRTKEVIDRIVQTPSVEDVKFLAGPDIHEVEARTRKPGSVTLSADMGMPTFPAAESIMIRTFALPKEVPQVLRFSDHMIRFYGLVVETG